MNLLSLDDVENKVRKIVLSIDVSTSLASFVKKIDFLPISVEFCHSVHFLHFLEEKHLLLMTASNLSETLLKLPKF